jgi:hypothetical protein
MTQGNHQPSVGTRSTKGITVVLVIAAFGALFFLGLQIAKMLLR